MTRDTGRAYNLALVGRQGLRARSAAVCADIPAREQDSCQICAARGLRGWVQVRPFGKQLSGAGHVHTCHAPSSHVTRTVSHYCDAKKNFYKNEIMTS